jgi:hypothetical protein
MADFGEQFLIDISLNAANSDPWDRTVNFETWKNAVLQQLVKIAASKGGMALLKAIQRTRVWHGIFPLIPFDAGKCNADTLDTLHFNVDPATPSKHRKYAAIIGFDPSQYVSGSLCYRNKHRDSPTSNRGARPDEVLFHELFHALRAGHRRNRKLGGGLARYQSLEEFLAVVVTNIYISDRTNSNKSGLRADHSDHRPLEANLDTSLKFFRSSPQVLPLLRQLVADEKHLCQDLCNVKATFNPIAAVMDTQLAGLLEKLSHTNLANSRELLGPLSARFATEPAPPPPEPMRALKTVAEALAQEALRMLKN